MRKYIGFSILIMTIFGGCHSTRISPCCRLTKYDSFERTRNIKLKDPSFKKIAQYKNNDFIIYFDYYDFQKEVNKQLDKDIAEKEYNDVWVKFEKTNAKDTLDITKTEIKGFIIRKSISKLIDKKEVVIIETTINTQIDVIQKIKYNFQKADRWGRGGYKYKYDNKVIIDIVLWIS